MTVEEKNHKVQEVGAGLVGSVCRRQPELGVWTCRGGGGGGRDGSPEVELCVRRDGFCFHINHSAFASIGSHAFLGTFHDTQKLC